MKYFKLSSNASSKKWMGYLNPQTKLFSKTGAISAIALSNQQGEIHQTLFYKVLTEGKTPPVNTLGSRAIMFDSNIPNIKSLIVPGVQLVSIKNEETQHQYLMMHLYKHVDCVNWDLSEYEPWPKNYEPSEWEYKKGRFFLNPVIDDKKIPKTLCAFRLSEWGDAFNIVVSEELKRKILSLDFDHSFLEFHEIAKNFG